MQCKNKDALACFNISDYCHIDDKIAHHQSIKCKVPDWMAAATTSTLELATLYHLSCVAKPHWTQIPFVNHLSPAVNLVSCASGRVQGVLQDGPGVLRTLQDRPAASQARAGGLQVAQGAQSGRAVRRNRGGGGRALQAGGREHRGGWVERRGGIQTSTS